MEMSQKFAFFFHRGGGPSGEKEGKQIVAEWKAWHRKIEERVADVGYPLGQSLQVHADGEVTFDDADGNASGYCVIRADDIEAAVDIARGCPILNYGGRVNIVEVIDSVHGMEGLHQNPSLADYLADPALLIDCLGESLFGDGGRIGGGAADGGGDRGVAAAVTEGVATVVGGASG